MQKKVTTIGIAIILVIVGSIAFLISNQSEETSPDQSRTQASETTSMTGNEDPPGSTTGAYANYSIEAVANTPGTKLLFFHAPWCPQCRALEADIQESGIPADVMIFKVDYDNNQELRQKYGVTLQTTIVKVDERGNLIDKFVAYDKPSVAAIKDRLL